MADERETGGPAFPHQRDHVLYHQNDPTIPAQTIKGVWDGGMTLRDYFAGQALPQAIAHEIALQGTQINPGGFRYANVALSAYVMADAMLEARK